MSEVKKITREIINHNYYQKHQEELKERRRAKWKQSREIIKKEQDKQLNKYYGAASIKILMSLKNYTELNSHKHKLWLDFGWTLNDCQQGLGDIVAVMKLREVADILIADYWKTAKKEIEKGKSWTSLSETKQSKLIKYWGREKARREKQLNQELIRLDEQGESYEQDIELVKFHEERGKVKCVCWSCAESKRLVKLAKQEQ